jgi:thiosulfate/3-mercaptopyruvate sulfurtransferase
VTAEIEVDELAARLGEVPILDVRGAGEYDGTFGKPCDPRQGHLPGAVHLDLYRMMELAPADVGAALGLEPGAEIVAYCHSGSRSAVAVQVLRALGYDARNYVGSWHEWSRLEHLPVER